MILAQEHVFSDESEYLSLLPEGSLARRFAGGTVYALQTLHVGSIFQTRHCIWYLL